MCWLCDRTVYTTQGNPVNCIVKSRHTVCIFSVLFAGRIHQLRAVCVCIPAPRIFTVGADYNWDGLPGLC